MDDAAKAGPGPAAAPGPRRAELSLDDYLAGVHARDRAVLGRAITLVESRHPAHQALAGELLKRLLPEAGAARRVGITGVPGVGKSTFIDALGTMLTGAGHRVAVLTVDPSSGRSGGSILGDKTRMARLSVDDAAFIRPSPAAGTLGGVARKTRETMVLCEAAGFDVVLVETIGVGQSETTVREMVDFFLVLMIAGAGDELQGIKKGVLELADMIAVNKADGDNVERVRRAAREYRSALHLLRPASPDWSPPVVTCSGLTGAGLPELWDEIERHRKIFTDNGELERTRARQMLRWMWALLEDRLLDELRHHPQVAALLPELEDAVLAGRLTPGMAADRALAVFRGEEPEG